MAAMNLFIFLIHAEIILNLVKLKLETDPVNKH